MTKWVTMPKVGDLITLAFNNTVLHGYAEEFAIIERQGKVLLVTLEMSLVAEEQATAECPDATMSGGRSDE